MAIEIEYAEDDIGENRKGRDVKCRLQESIWKMINLVMTT